MNTIWNFPQSSRWDLENIFRQTNTLNREKVTLEDLKISKTIVALSMQYTSSWDIDINFLENQLQNLANNWIKTVLVAWTTWESSSMSINEQITYVRIASNLALKYWISIIAGAGSNSTSEQNELITWVLWGNFTEDKTQTSQVENINLEKSKAVATLLLPPYYVKTSSENLIRHLTEWLNRWPAIIYSIKWRTWMEIPLEVLEILSTHPNFLWVKECDWTQRIKYLSEKGITVWCWNDDCITLDMQNWAYWAISVTAGIIPKKVINIIENKLTFWDDVEDNNIASNLLFPPNYPNPHLIHNVFSMINYTWEKVVFRSPVGPIWETAQNYVLEVLNILWIKANAFWDNFEMK